MYWYLPANNLLASLTASSQNAYWPAANLYQSPLACDVWRSAFGNSTETLTIPLGGSYKSTDYPNGLDLLVDSWNAYTACSAVTATLTGPGTVINLTPAALVNGQPVPQRFNIPLNASTGTTAIVLTFTMQSPGSSTYMQVGKIFLGPYYDSGDQGSPDVKGFTRTFDELTNTDTSVLGQDFSEMRAQFWSGTIKMSAVSEAVQSGLRTLAYEVLGTFTPFWVIIDPEVGATAELGYPRYCKITKKPTEQMVTYGAGWVWSVSLAVKKLL